MQVLEESLKKYFDDKKHFEQLKSLMSNKCIQPRLIDYYVTQYSKNNPEFFITDEGVNDVYNSYKLQLKGYHKKCFNLFDKKNLIMIYHEGNFVMLPLAKVNVYRWLLSNGITNLLDDKKVYIQKKYYDFRKITVDKTRKRGKMSTFAKTPTLIHGLLKSIKKKC